MKQLKAATAAVSALKIFGPNDTSWMPLLLLLLPLLLLLTSSMRDNSLGEKPPSGPTRKDVGLNPVTPYTQTHKSYHTKSNQEGAGVIYYSCLSYHPQAELSWRWKVKDSCTRAAPPCNA